MEREKDSSFQFVYVANFTSLPISLVISAQKVFECSNEFLKCFIDLER